MGQGASMPDFDCFAGLPQGMATGDPTRMSKHRKKQNGRAHNLAKKLNQWHRETLTRPSSGKQAETAETMSEDAFYQKLLEDERAFLNPEEWGIDLKTIVLGQIQPPSDPDGLRDEEVSIYLHAMVDLMAQYHLALVSTNHLTDRELYRFILERIIPQPLGIGPNPIGSLIYHECCPCDDIEQWFRYYASDEEREDWECDSDDPLPEKAPLVADRDEWLEALAESYRDRPLPLG
jgi:hypothetical protein